MATVLTVGIGPALATTDDIADMTGEAPIDPAFLKDISGAWTIKDQSGKKTCRVTLGLEATIGGFVIAVDPACAKTFPVMDEITTWRLGDNAAIVLADGTRKTRVLFYTPDNSYVATREIDGIFTIVKD